MLSMVFQANPNHVRETMVSSVDGLNISERNSIRRFLNVYFSAFLLISSHLHVFLNTLHVILSFVNEPALFYRLYRSSAKSFGILNWAAVTTKITGVSNDSTQTEWVSLLFQDSTVTWQMKMKYHYILSAGLNTAHFVRKLRPM